MQTESKKLTREELYQLVWSKPATKLAQELGISDVAITKLCRRHSVPKPGLGYWRALECGHKATVPPLPPGQEGSVTHIEIWPQVREKKEPQHLPAEVVELIENEKLAVNRIVVPEDLENAHPVIRRTLQLFKKAESDNYGRLSVPWNKERPKLAVNVSREGLDRSLRILNALFAALHKRGHKIKVTENTARAEINGETVSFSIREKVDRSEWTRQERSEPGNCGQWKFTPTGLLTLTISSWAKDTRSKWTDKKGKPLEDQLNGIFIGMLTHAALSPAARLEWQEREAREEQLRRETEQRRWKEELRRYEFTRRREAFETQLDSWTKSRNVRMFLQECEHFLSEQGKLETEKLENRCLGWLRNYADSLDPLKNGKLREIIRMFEKGDLELA